jgi:hypothetical protein
MYEYDNKENIIKDFETFKNNMLETDLQKLIDLYVMSLYYDIMDYCNGDDEETPDVVIDKIENTIKEYYNN